MLTASGVGDVRQAGREPTGVLAFSGVDTWAQQEAGHGRKDMLSQSSPSVQPPPLGLKLRQREAVNEWQGRGRQRGPGTHQGIVAPASRK